MDHRTVDATAATVPAGPLRGGVRLRSGCLDFRIRYRSISMTSVRRIRIALALGFILTLAADARAQLVGNVYVSGLNLPVAFAQDPSDPTVQFVLEQGGLIRVIKDGVLQPTPFLDLTTQISSGGERGLLGMALDPAYGSNRRFYLNFTNPAGHTVVARFTRSVGNALLADPNSRFDFQWSTGLRVIEQPFNNHNGGSVE